MNVYIKAQDSVCLNHKEIKMKDILSLYCSNKDIEQAIKNKSVIILQKGITRENVFPF